MAPRGRPRAAAASVPEKADNDVVTNGTATRPSRTKKSATPAVNGTATAPAEKAPAARGRAKKDSAPPAESKEAPKPAGKRKIEEEDDDEPVSEASAPKSKKPKTAVAEEGPKPKGPRRIRGKKTEINPIRYTEPLKIFVFGEGSSGELGLGAHKKAKDVKRPRFNEALTNMNVVRVVTGGMHVVALTKDNKILTWGVNDNGALGRDTSGAEVLRDIDADGSGSDSEDEDETGGLNALEATPTAISSEYFPEDTVFVDVAAGDSCSFALTTEGAVYGWGTFRKNEGILGFGRKINTATTPVYIDGITKVTQLVCGTNHVLALDKDRHVYAWGNGQQNQLGRRVTERTLIESLQPNRVGFHDTSVKRPSQRIAKIFCGDYYSFAIGEDGHVWAWGANNYCETGHPEDAGNDNASVLTPRIVQSLEGKGVTSIASGSHHSVVFTTSGKVYVWGRCDGSQTGIPMKDLNDIIDEDKVLKSEAGKAKILLEPTEIPSLQDIVTGAVGPEHSIVINKDGKAYAWGFSSNYQTGLGTGDDIETPTLIDNTAVRDTKLIWAGCGGQFSMLASKKE